LLKINREKANKVPPEKKASAQFGIDRTPEALFARVPGGNNRHEGGYIFG
jgi:hypothetical protein